MSTDVSALIQMATMCVLLTAIQICYMVFLVSQGWWTGGNGSAHEVDILRI